MLRPKPDTLALIITFVCTVAVLAVMLSDLLLSRNRDIEAGELRLQEFSKMMAEHTSRSFDAVDILLREMAIDLSNHEFKWEAWSPATGWEYLAKRQTRAIPQLRDLIIFDRYGNQRFFSAHYPAPASSVSGQPFFEKLAGGADTATYGPYLGFGTSRYTYALTRRIVDRDKHFVGLALANMEPAYLHDFCWSNRLSDGFDSVLINSAGQIVASCRPTDLSRQSPLLGALATDVLFAGKLRNNLPESGLRRANGLLISILPVSGFADLRILTAIPEEDLLINWRHELTELGSVSLLITVILLVGGLLVRRQIRQMATMANELASNREHLEERIEHATLELASEKDAAERANKAKSRFLAAASHDLRQPLHALSLFAADLQRQVRSGVVHEQERLAEQIATSTRILGELLDSLLDLSRLDVTGITPEIQTFPLDAVFERLNNSFRRATADRKQTLRFRKTRQWLVSDPGMIERILANLISNALRYTPVGGKILVAARRRDSEVQIEVRDNGVGIASENQAAIFAEFYQVDNAAREQNKGLGLGLSIVDRLSRALGLKVELSSRLGQGTTFSFRVAIGQPVNQSLPENRPQAAGKVHLIGISEDIQACITLLKNWNYSTSQEGYAAGKVPPAGSIVIVDASQATAASAEQSPDTPLVILLNDGATPVPAGAHALPTPVRPAKLRALLNQLQKTLPKSIP